MKIKGLNIAIVSLACLTVVALAGSSLGTLAWYAYSTRATVAYSGTAVQKTEQLQIGLEWDATKYPVNGAVATQYKTDYEATIESIGTKSYCFMAGGAGFSSAGITKYLELHGFATNELPPVTSRSYASGSASFHLYESPTFGYPNNTAYAAKNRYVELPFAFRIKSDSSAVASQNIWLTDVTAAAASTKDVKDALRIHVHNEEGEDAAHQNFILHPASESLNGGSTYVGGVLDLNGDGVYDYGDQKVGGITRLVEYRYGECVPDEAVNPTPFATTAYKDVNEYFDDSETHGEEDRNTFFAQHAQGIYGYEDYANITRGVAQYVTFNQVRPQESGGGSFSAGYPIAKTDAETGVGLCTLTVWLEGWDHAIIDANIGAKFNLGLQFEINRV